MVTGTTMDGNMEGSMSAELVAIIAAAVSLGGSGTRPNHDH